MITTNTRETQLLEWLKEHGSEQFIPADKMPEDFKGLSLDFNGAIIMIEGWLEKDKEDHTYRDEQWVRPFHENQMIAGAEVISKISKRKFCNDRKNTYTQLCSQTQAGKTGALVAIDQFFNLDFFRKTIKMGHSMTVQCPADKSLAEQTNLRTPLRVATERMSMKTTLDAAKSCKQDWDNCKSMQERSALRRKWSNQRKSSNPPPLPVILPNSLVMLDESHHGTGKKSIAEQVLNVWGIDLSQDPETWGVENVHIISVSATPMAEVLATQNYPWVDRVILQPGSTYYGIGDMLKDGRVKESWPLKSKKDVQKLIDDVVEPFLEKRENKFGIIRLPTGKSNNFQYSSIANLLKKVGIRILKEIPTAHNSSNYDVAFVELNQSTSRDKDLQEFLGAPSSGQDKWFSAAPPIPTIVFVKNMLAMGATLKNEHISFVFERKRKNDKTDVDFAVQSLAGRATGYDDKSHCPVVYSSLEDLQNYRDWVDSGYKATVTPAGARRTRARKKVGYPPHTMVIPESTLSQDEKDLLDPNTTRSRKKTIAVIEGLVQSFGDPSLKSSIDSIEKDDWSNIYRLRKWKQDKYDFYSGQLQEPEAMGLKGYIQRDKKCTVFLDKDSNAYKISMIFKAEEKIHRDPVPNQTMYQQ